MNEDYPSNIINSDVNLIPIKDKAEKDEENKYKTLGFNEKMKKIKPIVKDQFIKMDNLESILKLHNEDRHIKDMLTSIQNKAIHENVGSLRLKKDDDNIHVDHKLKDSDNTAYKASKCNLITFEKI